MCGFLVEYRQDGIMLKDDFIKILTLSQKRGPDFQGYWNYDGKIQMGFNRLAILDLSEAGQQPMHSFGNRYTIVFNGEIYNHLELRNKLEFNKFKGKSDTETITACLEEWGLYKTINELDGIFAIVIYDHEQKNLSLVRDFAGVKPLFYGQKGNKLVASSQYDQIINHPVFVNSKINPQVLKLYLQQHFIPAPFGLYENTFQVLPGEIITIDKIGNTKRERYWELKDSTDFSVSNQQEAENLIAETLNSCIKDQLLSDVPLGAFLSGGVDSPLICSLIKNTHPHLKVFTIGSDSVIHDETERSIQFAKALQLEQRLWKLDAKEIVSHWDEVLKSIHEPFADFSIFPTFLVSKLARNEVTVALSGDGGDELFFGYERFWSVSKNIKYQHYPIIFKKGIYAFDKYISKSGNINSILLSSSQSKAHENLHSRFRKQWLDKIAPDLMSVELPEGWDVYNYSDCQNERELLSKMRKAEFYGMMQKTLRKVDLASMENSLEVRVPFLQKKMIQASMQIDPLLNSMQGRQKELLKNCLFKINPQVPKETVKKGFSVPLSKWIREDLKNSFSTTLLEGKSELYGFNKNEIEKMLQAHNELKEDLKWPLFTLLSLLK